MDCPKDLPLENNKTTSNNALDVQTPYRSSVASAGPLLVIKQDVKTGWRFWDLKITKRDAGDKKILEFWFVEWPKELPLENNKNDQ